MSILENTDTALTAFAKARDALKDVRSGSLIEYTGSARVEPVTLLDSSLRHQLYMTDVLQSVVSIFSGYYLQAVALSCNIGNIDTMRLLDKLNPKRDPLDSAGRGATRLARFASEQYLEGLPFKVNISLEANEQQRRRTFVGMSPSDIITKKDIEKAVKSDKRDVERTIRREIKKGSRKRERKEKEKDSVKTARFGRDTISNIETSSNLSVGKMLEVQISDGTQNAVIPVSVRLMTKVIPGASLVAALTLSSQERTAAGRYHAWRAGELEFVNDIIMCQDIIDKHKKAALADKEGVISATITRVQKNKLSALLSGDFSVASASSIVILTSETAQLIERELNGRLRNFRVREKLFIDTHTMLLIVIDTQWEQAVIYHRSISDHSEISIKEFKSSSRGSGPDVSEILAAYRAGSAPTI